MLSIHRVSCRFTVLPDHDSHRKEEHNYLSPRPICIMFGLTLPICPAILVLMPRLKTDYQTTFFNGHRDAFMTFHLFGCAPAVSPLRIKLTAYVPPVSLPFIDSQNIGMGNIILPLENDVANYQVVVVCYMLRR